MAKASVVAAKSANALEALVEAVARVEAQNVEILTLLRPTVSDEAPQTEETTVSDEAPQRRNKRA